MNNRREQKKIEERGSQTVAATIDQIAGVYSHCNIEWKYLYLYYDGTYLLTQGLGEIERGRFVLQSSEVKLIPVIIEYDSNEEHILPIDVINEKVGKFKKQPFLTESQIAQLRAEDGIGDDCAFAGTLKDFKKLSALE